MLTNPHGAPPRLELEHAQEPPPRRSRPNEPTDVARRAFDGLRRGESQEYAAVGAGASDDEGSNVWANGASVTFSDKPERRTTAPPLTVRLSSCRERRLDNALALAVVVSLGVPFVQF